MSKTITLNFFLICFFNIVNAQVIWTEPFFPEVDDDVTVYYDASEGNGALSGFGGDIYAHAGVITDQSNGLSDWKYVVSDWGTTDPNVLMTDLGNDLYSISYNIRDYYGIPMGEEVLQLSFVFRDGAGNIVGRNADGSDIYTPVYQLNGSIETRFLTPTTNFVATINQPIEVYGVASANADLYLYDNGSLITQTIGTSIQETLMPNTTGSHLIEFIADDGNSADTSVFSYIVPLDPPVQDPPAGTRDGINYTSSTSVTLRLYAPGKENVFVLGDFNDWQLDEDFQMNMSSTGIFWLEINNLVAGQYYTFQYLVDGVIRTADPYSELVLHDTEDEYISEETFPNLPPYPVGNATQEVSLIQPDAPAFNWQTNGYQRPEKTDLVIYELLMRDFLQRHDYQTLLDTLDYLDRMGITAIELMPVNEFDGNESWGYNPSYHMALDKYYGSPEAFKTLIDECHARGIAVILDVVYNHVTGRSPLAKLYWDAPNSRPATDNPWLNPEATHPFNVFNDMNHESQATQNWVDRILEYWLTEYRVDGFRFDLSKGFTQTDYGDDVGAWGGYDAGRIAIIKHYADVVWTHSPGAYVILEHFGGNTEETELSEYGAMFWGNMNHNANEGTMGYPGNGLNGLSYTSRGWDDPHLVSFVESHDEERLMYKNLEFGNSSGNYSVKYLETALQRQEMITAFYYSVPGPKMLWQFGELGYDYSINYCPNGTIDESCRVANKPIRWDYQNEPARAKLYNVTRAMMNLRKDYPVFATTDFNMQGNGYNKRINLNHPDMNVTTIANFNVSNSNNTPNFQHTGMWYEYFTGDSLMVENMTTIIELLPGEYRLYTDIKLPEPPGGYMDFVLDAVDIEQVQFNMDIYPNPSAGATTIEYSISKKAKVQVAIYNHTGQLIRLLHDQEQLSGAYNITLEEFLPKGLYFVKLKVDDQSAVRKLIIH
jgi:glycosidase